MEVLRLGALGLDGAEIARVGVRGVGRLGFRV